MRFRFLEFDLEPMVDKLYFFNGSHTNQPILAILTGQKIPADLTSWSNEVLLWFVTDSRNEGRGWSLSFEFVDP